MESFRSWIAVFGEEGAAFDADGRPLIRLSLLKTSRGNIAGVDIPSSRRRVRAFGLRSLLVPLWLDAP
jgi:hypothetical protein